MEKPLPIQADAYFEKIRGGNWYDGSTILCDFLRGDRKIVKTGQIQFDVVIQFFMFTFINRPCNVFMYFIIWVKIKFIHF